MARMRMAAAALPTAMPAMAGVERGWDGTAAGDGEEDVVGLVDAVGGRTGSAVVIMNLVVGWWDVTVRVEVTRTVVSALSTLSSVSMDELNVGHEMRDELGDSFENGGHDI